MDNLERVRCDYCDHQIPMSIRQERDGYVPPSVCESCAIVVNQQLDEIAEEFWGEPNV